MINWDKLKEDVWKGVKDGMEAVKEGAQKGAEATAKKAGELKDEGAKRLHVYRLKRDIHEQMAELGAKVYKAEKDSPGTINDASSMDIVVRIDALEKELEEAEK